MSEQLKNYVGFARDHSGSMRLLTEVAANDYNENIAQIKEQATSLGIDTVVSVVKCGVGSAGRVERDVVNSSVNALAPLAKGDYVADGGSTPLFDSVGELIDMFSAVPDAADPKVSFLIMITTDGQENSSKKWNGKSLGQRIKELQATDRWTFVFRVPQGEGRSLAALGIPAGNILEWELSKKGVEVSTQLTRSAFTQYYSARSSGATSSKSFYTNLADISQSDLQAQLVDVTRDVVAWPVLALDNDRQIKEFVEGHTGRPLRKGTAFYELVKTEKEVQDYKVIVIRDRTTGLMYSGKAARQMLGLPTFGTVRVVPGNHSAYAVFVQSTSTSRKVVAGTDVLLYERAAV